MEPAALSALILIGASALIYWGGRKDGAHGATPAFAIPRIVFHAAAICMLLWVWGNTPPAAFTPPAWRHVSFIPAATGIACCIAMDTRGMIASTKRPSDAHAEEIP